MSAGRNVKDWMGKPAPPGYIAGLGRGATGFMTRPDLGPGQQLEGAAGVTSTGQRSYSDRANLPPAVIRSMQAAAAEEAAAMRYDEAHANEEGLLAPSGRGVAAAEDIEADRIFAAIDERMAQRRRRKGAAESKVGKDPLERDAGGNPSELWTDLKRDLVRVSEAEWANIPEVGSFTAKRFKKSTNDKERYTPLPDSIIMSALGAGSFGSGTVEEDPLLSNLNSSSNSTDFRAIGEARERVLGHRLDQIVQAKTHQNSNGLISAAGEKPAEEDSSTVNNPFFKHAAISSSSDLVDIERARRLLKSVVSSNKTNSQAWIAAVRLEERALNLRQARHLISQACEACPGEAEVWLEALRLCPTTTPPSAGTLKVMADALNAVPDSPKLWGWAVQLEASQEAKRRILQRALERLPHDAELWRMLIEMEAKAADQEEDLRQLLRRAVECVPGAVEFWIALARLEPHEEARRLLNKARRSCPGRPEVWIAAARLEEANGATVAILESLLEKALQDIRRSKESFPQPAAEWLRMAWACEETQDVLTAEAICTVVFRSEADPSALSTWLDHAQESAQTAHRVTAKAILEAILADSPSFVLAWKLLVEMERSASSFERAITACPGEVDFWIAYAEHCFKDPSMSHPMGIMNRATQALPSEEKIWLGALRILEALGGANLVDDGRGLLLSARQNAGSARVWKYSAKFEWRVAGNPTGAVNLLQEALQPHPRDERCWLLLLQILTTHKESWSTAGKIFEDATACCPASIDIWIQYGRFEEALASATPNPSLIRARSILEKARQVTKPAASADPYKRSLLWIESIEMELRAGQAARAKQLLNLGLAELSHSGLLWAESIWMETRPLRRSRAATALMRCRQSTASDNAAPSDPAVHAAVGRLMWAEEKTTSAREHYERALSLDPGNGDIWAEYLVFLYNTLSQDATNESFQHAWALCLQAAPKTGRQWREWRRRSCKTCFFVFDPSQYSQFIQAVIRPLLISHVGTTVKFVNDQIF